MSSSNPGGHEDEEEDEDAERVPFSLQLPPQTPSTNFFLDSHSFLAEDLLGYTEDLSLLFPDDYYYTQTDVNPYDPSPLVVDNSTTNITHQQFEPHQTTEAALLTPAEQQISSGELGEAGPSSSTLPSSSAIMMDLKKKKMDHNAKERVRRLQANASYLALRSLLPNSQKPKDKWSAPYIIDRALDHIPQLEGEIGRLKSSKEEMMSELERAHHLRRAQDLQEQALSVSINEVRKGQVIIQVICHPRNKADIFSELLLRLESQGMEVLDASEFDPCEDRSCYHVRIQMDESSTGDGYVAELKEKVVSWLS